MRYEQDVRKAVLWVTFPTYILASIFINSSNEEACPTEDNSANAVCMQVSNI